MDTWNGRVEETGLYERMGWKSVGVAFCVGLAEEVEVTLCEFLRAWRCSPIYGSEGVSKSKLYLPELKPRQDLIGLFVGHDIIFIEGSETPVTIAGEGSNTARP
ncbi:DUF1847 domain-containing protein [Methanopyrus sp. KOL6]|uniref:DUF1847 domain-containing protein n=1 Tax=Methanopyrus sp. KOL6 TaxID=1937004 RepID=UPI000B4C1FBE|nr:DUF1847 domain-containing protein [Methanopyrus sp. KOL6]